jgi:predicted membrane protein
VMTLLSLVVVLAVVAVVGWLTNTYVPMPRKIKPILNIVLGLIVVGIVLWLINTYVPMAGSIKAILNIVVVLATCVRVLQEFGLWSQVVKVWRKTRQRSLPSGPDLSQTNAR